MRVFHRQLSCLPALLICLIPGFLQAEDKEESEKLLRLGPESRLAREWTSMPDPNKEFVPRGRGGIEIKEFNAPDARVKPFYYDQLFFEKEFLSQEYTQVRSFRSEHYKTEEFDSGENLYQSDAQPILKAAENANIEQFQTTAPTEEFETEQSPDADRESHQADDEFTDSRQIPIEEMTANPLDDAQANQAEKEFPVREPMDIEDVRELLNKN